MKPTRNSSSVLLSGLGHLFLLQHYSSIFVIHHEDLRIYSGHGLGENTEKKIIDPCTVLMEKTRETQLLHSLTNLLHPLSFQLAGARR